MKRTVITCFSYNGDKEYEFGNVDDIIMDLQRILRYSFDIYHCDLENIHVLTDLVPCKRTYIQLRNEFRINLYRQSRTILEDTTPYEWLCENSGTEIYYRMVRRMWEILSDENIIEFCSLFTDLRTITGKVDYMESLTEIITPDTFRLFMYYTGHCQEDHMIIPKGDVCSKEEMGSMLHERLKHTSAVVVFDCCHAESIFLLPCRLTLSPNVWLLKSGFEKSTTDTICISSTRNDQTCGFYTRGSLFTYFLVKQLHMMSLDIDGDHSLYRLGDIEDRIQKYREVTKKGAQNINVGVSRHNITALPSWLFDNRYIP